MLRTEGSRRIEHVMIRSGGTEEHSMIREHEMIRASLSVVMDFSQESSDSSSETDSSGPPPLIRSSSSDSGPPPLGSTSSDSLPHLADVNDRPLHPPFWRLFRRRSPRAREQITEVPTPLVNAALPVPRGRIREYHWWGNRPLPALEEMDDRSEVD